jgi:hypothetical protein
LRYFIMIDSEYSSRIAWTKFSILAKLQPELRNSDTTVSEKRRDYRWSSCRIKMACAVSSGPIPPTTVSWRQRALRTRIPPLSGATVAYGPRHGRQAGRHVRAAPRPPSCGPVRPAPRPSSRRRPRRLVGRALSFLPSRRWPRRHAGLFGSGGRRWWNMRR